MSYSISMWFTDVQRDDPDGQDDARDDREPVKIGRDSDADDARDRRRPYGRPGVGFGIRTACPVTWLSERAANLPCAC